MIYVKIIAYNAADTLNRAVDSVLNQTYQDFKCYLCDNGSTDNGKTRKIVEAYAKSDERIVPFYNEENQVFDNSLGIVALAHNIEDEDIFCTLDADDAYEITFLEEMLAFMNENNLDIAACGNELIDAVNHEIIGTRILPYNLIVEGDDFSNQFPVYHQFIRSIWGKLFKGKTVKKTYIGIDPNDPIPRVYGNDTFFTMCALTGAKRVGILSKTLHKYYISNKSTSYYFHPNRIECDIILHEAALDLLKPYGEISLKNLVFLYAVYYNATQDTLDVLIKSNLSILEKIQYIRDIFAGKYMKEVLTHVLNNDDLFEYTLLRKNLLKYLINQEEARSVLGARLIAEIIDLTHIEFQNPLSQDNFEYLILNMPNQVEQLLDSRYEELLESLNGWYKNHDKDNPALTALELVALAHLNTSDDEIFKMFLGVRKERPMSYKAMQIEAQLIQLMAKYPLLTDLSANLACDLDESVRWVMKNDIPQAFEAFIALENVSVEDSDLEAYILFGQNLSALIDNTDAFIYFKKMMISYFISVSRIEEALQEYYEYEPFLPNDSDFAMFREKLRLNA